MRHISIDLIRATEAAAIAASKFVGSGDKLSADKAATTALRDRLNKMNFCGCVVIGEGKKDCGDSNDYGLYEGEYVGNQDFSVENIKYNLAIDPIEGSTPTVASGPEAISTLAVAHENSMFSTSHFYAHKLAYGPNIKKKVTLSLEDPLEKTIELASKATGKPNERITVCVLNRPRHDETIALLRKLGVRIKLINDCDVTGAVAVCLPESGVDLLYGIGGAPEAVISACAIKCLGGDFQAQVTSRPDWEPEGPILGLEDLVKGECVFVATGITNGSILKGVRHTTSGTITNSVFMRSESGTVRWLEVNHGN